ncbi:capsular polysaccharide biosynthesis protein [Arsukibacterium sp.]|uniref:capsular polysaccharide export protein, LipB/KpsS family n=1 Tax=Arsukibacterium sp. TaxID=1977258 RepID=UPI001BD6193E|nr:capsular polysaccharide biosynthesis protein [Arsukibacterium sp.]
MAGDQGLLFCPPLNGKEPVMLVSNTAPERFRLQPLLSAQDATTAQFIQCWQQAAVSRYNRYPDADTIPPAYVLLVLQTNMPKAVVSQMFVKARHLAQQSDAVVLVCHDQHASCQLAAAYCNNSLVQLCPPQVHHAKLLANAAAVITANSWLGFEALLWRKAVYSFLPSFYLDGTHYCGSPSEAEPTAADDSVLGKLVWQIFSDAKVDSALTDGRLTKISHDAQLEPGSGFITSMQAIQWLSWQRQQRQRFAPELYAIGFNRIWRPVVKQFIQGSKLHFVKRAKQVPTNSHAVSWGFKPLAGLAESVSLTRLEDGFLRSVGLGAQFVKPLSWVADSCGLYFDATAPSDLENLLAQHPFSQPLLEQAAELISQLQSSGISKYNTGIANWQRPVTAKKVILVPGQVETDASIARGAPGIKQNMALLQAVRQANPDAWLIYKPHPDVLAGARARGENEQQALDYCDQQVTDCSIVAMFDQIDEVHVLTSLAGFEALIRGVKVTCYGMPFYAGWGLTTDKYQCQRRGRQLTLQQLVAATLLLYPLYICRHTGYYTNALATLADLQQWRQQKPTFSSKLWQWLRWGLNNFVKPK